MDVELSVANVALGSLPQLSFNSTEDFCLQKRCTIKTTTRTSRWTIMLKMTCQTDNILGAFSVHDIQPVDLLSGGTRSL